MKNIDEYITNLLKQDISEPTGYENAIRTALKSKKYHKYKYSKIISIAASIIIVTTGIVYGKDIINGMKNLFNDSNGLTKAIDNNYIAEPNIDYIDSNNTKVKVENFLMDDFNLNFVFDINLDNTIDTNSVERVNLPDLLITDEDNNILYCENETTLEEYCKNNNISDYLNSEKYINSGSNWYVKSKDEETNTIKLVYNFYSSSYPKSKKIYVSFNQIKFTKKDNSEAKEFALKGTWNINLDVPEKFYNREAEVYSVKSCSNPNINITEALLYDTGFRIKFNTTVDPIYEETDSEEIKNEKYDKFSEWYMKELNECRDLTYDDYVMNEKGEKFYPLNSSIEDSETEYLPNGEFTYMQTFDLTKYDNNSNNITVYVKINLPDYKEEVKIELERKES